MTDDAILIKIRALLAKAESTNFPDEARMYSAKAQELMSKWAIDEAMLQAAGQGPLVGQIEQSYIWLDANEFRAPKITLLVYIAEVNNCKLVTFRQEYRMVSGERKRQFRMGVVGFDSDRHAVEILFTSMLTQIARESLASSVLDAMACECPQGGHRIAWKNAFVMAYAHAVGRRLRDAKAIVTRAAEAQYSTGGAGCVALVLADRSALVLRKYEEFYPKLGKAKRSSSTHRFGSASSHGHQAGIRADLGQPKVGGNRQSITN